MFCTTWLVTDLDHDRVQEHDGVDGIERPVLPGPDLFQYGIADADSIDDLETRVEVNRGGPGNPLSDEELARKFHDNAVRSLPEERAAEIAPERSPFLTLRASRISPRC